MLFLHYFGAEYKWNVYGELARDNFPTDAFRKLWDSYFMQKANLLLVSIICFLVDNI